MLQTHPLSSEFYEVQQFRQPWLWISLLLTAFGVAGIFLYGAYRQLYLGEPWGDRPMSDARLIMSAVVSMTITGGIALLFYLLKLITTVNSDGVSIRFFPLTHRRIPFSQITSCTPRSYRPIREYGGWGIRFSRKGRAYNVRGNRGVQLHLSRGLPVLIGSQQADRLAEAINRHLGR